MKTFYYSAFCKYKRILFLFIALISFIGDVLAQNATVAIPVAIGTTCGATKDSVKYFNYKSSTNVLTHRSNCKPSLASPGFSSNLATITFNPYDGYLYYTQIALVSGIYNSYTYRWLPTTCPGPNAPVYKTFLNQFVAGVEFDPSTGLGYQINFVDSTGYPPMNPDGPSAVGQYTSGAVINNNPAIAYYDLTNQKLKYVRANDASGQTWGTPVAVATTGSVGQYTSMTVVNGNPAIAYYDATNLDLKYLRATDVSGTVWGTPVTPEATNNIGQFTSMTVVNGNPAISYYDVTNLDLRYVRATDASGTVWGTPVAVATTGSVGQYTSMIVVNGNPAISYYDATNKDLKYVRASNANGTIWGTPVTAEATGDVGQYSSLIIANGDPAVCYYDVTNTDVKYVRSYDVNGAIWYKNTGIYKMELQQVNFTTGVLGISQPINFGSRYIYKQTGDVVMTPGNQLLAVYNNKYFTVNWQAYNTAIPLVATYIDTLRLGTGNDLVGLAYSDGKLVGSISNSTACSSSYKQVDILTGALTNITYNAGATLFVSTDMTDITSGIGSAKKLISATENPVGSNTYDIVYEVYIKNYGGTPVTNVQAYDTLTKINGVANVISGSITSFIAPAGIIQNASYNGKTVGNFNLLTPGGTLSNIPGQNTITLQITCKISNILPGIVYNNQAVVSGIGLFGDNLRDSSTNGSIPDLNQNDKPDDVGESQPTPLLIAITPQTPPCSALTNVLYTQDFGSGTGLTTTIPAPVLGSGASLGTGTTSYTGSMTQPIPTDSYTLTDTAQKANTIDFLSLRDHTGNINGRMLVVNADAANTIMYRATFLASLCANQEYSLSFYAAFVGNSAYQTVCDAFGGFKYPKIKMRVIDGISGSIISQVSTSDITNTTWQQFGFKFVTPTSFSSIIIELSNDAPGGCGNDIAIDDIRFGNCDALPVINVSGGAAGCMGSSTTFTSSLSDPSALPGTKDYQWQIANALAGPYSNIAGATSSTYNIPSLSASDTGKYYRVIVAAQGNMGFAGCQYISPGIKLTGKISSVAPASATKNKNNICPGISVNLGITGGTLGTNASWKWYTGSCGTTLAGTGSTLNVTPVVTTTYYVRAEGDCNTTICQQVTVFISCDIDKDKDGIPDFVESNMAAALQDANANGIINAYDPTYPGYVDNNNDFINDNFQADGDSDNDGIPNYLDADFPGRIDTNGDGVDDRFDTDKDGIINMLDLDSDNDGIPDVVEAYGVDTNGDGKIDNFTDADGDGLSDQVDTNLSSAYNSGRGLGIPDFDGDGIPNYLDLDSDNDGIPDVVESGGPDINNDGKIDGFVDVNVDGLHDGYINATALLKTGIDINGDGKADSYPNKNKDQDFRPNAYDIDSDGDGIVDVIEAGFPDVDLNGIIDGAIGSNGWATVISSKVSLGLRFTDTDPYPDYLDIDSDNDGIPDNIEGQTTAGYKLPGLTDTDGDGLVDTYESVASKTVFGGSGIFVYDFDGDGIPDYRDLDTDGDGSPDIKEGNDFNLNGLADDLVTLTGLDTDGDGLDNRFDSLNSVTNLKGTSYMMGNGGSLIGDATPGSRCTVQKKTPAQIDRDWRYVGVVLPVQFLQLSGVLQTTKVLLNWTVIASKQVDHFEVERSTDNSSYINTGNVFETVHVNEQQDFAFTDDVASVSKDIIYYRIKVIGKAGEIQFSNLLVIRRQPSKTQLSIMPNPASNYVSVIFFAEKESEATIRLIDNLGKTVLLQKQRVAKGNNTLQLTALNKYGNAVYSLQLFVNGEVVIQKLVLAK